MGLFELIKGLFKGEPALPPPDVGHGVDELALRLQVRVQDLLDVKPEYVRFTIPKRHGTTRTIDAPVPALKQFQRRLLHNLLSRLRVHPAATGFQKGHSIATHAVRHAVRPVVVKLDIRDFFPSTRADRIHAYFRRIGWNQEAAELLTRWCTHEGGLPQGAPTSPRLSNLVNVRMDARLSALARQGVARFRNPKTHELVHSPGHAGIYYTRYADDMTFSFDSDVHGLVNSMIFAAQRIVEHEGYRLHTKKKLRIMRSHDRQVVTGLVVNAGVHLPRHTRRWLRAVEHHMATDRPCTLTPAQVQGWRALQGMIAQQAGAESGGRSGRATP